MNPMYENFKRLLNDGDIDLAISVVQSTDDCDEADNFVQYALSEDGSTPDLVDAALESFLKTHKHDFRSHGRWVHSLSHFTKKLWERRMTEWLKQLYEDALKWSHEVNNFNCCDRLVRDFGECSYYEDAAEDFGLTPESLSWMEWNPYLTYTKARIEAGYFDSEADFVSWKLQRLDAHLAWDTETQCELFDVEGFRFTVQHLQELGGDTSKCEALERKMLEKCLTDLEEELSSTEKEWKLEGLQKGIQKIRATLS